MTEQDQTTIDEAVAEGEPEVVEDEGLVSPTSNDVGEQTLTHADGVITEADRESEARRVAQGEPRNLSDFGVEAGETDHPPIEQQPGRREQIVEDELAGRVAEPET